jgi:tau tubulin kinase
MFSPLVAVKLEARQPQRATLKMEVAVLRAMGRHPAVPRLLGYGRLPQVDFIVLELLGANLSEVRKRLRPEQRFLPVTAARLGLQALEALRALHEKGVLHRDVKPSNFAFGRAEKRDDWHRLRVLDFGLVRLFLDPQGRPRAARRKAGFRGTARYASLAAHRGEDLGRVDDLWSLFYMLVELLVAKLPWRSVKDKDAVGAVG